MADRAFGRRLRSARQAAGYRTQQDFADEVGVNRATVGAWEAGTQSPERHLGLIERYLGVLGGSDVPQLRRVDAHTRRVIRAALPDDEDYRNVIGLLEGRLEVIPSGHPVQPGVRDESDRA